MTVAELIELLKTLPGHHPVRDADGNVVVGAGAGGTYGSMQEGPFVILHVREPK